MSGKYYAFHVLLNCHLLFSRAVVIWGTVGDCGPIHTYAIYVKCIYLIYLEILLLIYYTACNYFTHKMPVKSCQLPIIILPLPALLYDV